MKYILEWIATDWCYVQYEWHLNWLITNLMFKEKRERERVVGDGVNWEWSKERERGGGWRESKIVINKNERKLN